MSEPAADTSTKTLKLTKPLTGHEGQIDALTFDLPSGKDYFELGEVTEWQVTTDGQPLNLVREATVAAYVERCIRPADHRQYLPQLGFKDARGARKIIMGFFREQSSEDAG